jgi:hypothetical protein
VKDLETANANLARSLEECDRRLTDLGERPVMVQTPAADGGRRERRARAEMTKEDWENAATAGVVPVRIPCIRDKPWTPNDRVVDRLGLAPSDTDVIAAAYAASNKRMTDQIRPLCAQVLGSQSAANQVTTSSCIDVIAGSARKGGDDVKAALTRVAEVQAGKRAAAGSGDSLPIERLGLLLTKEQKTFEEDLAQKLGPDEAKRIANAPELCVDRRTLRTTDADDAPQGGGRRNRNR